MVGLSALWLPILLSAVFAFVVTMIVHMVPGWHAADMGPLPGEDTVLATLRAQGLQPGDYRFPYGATTAEMTAPAFVEKMKQGPVGIMTVRPTGEIPMGKLLGQWFVYVLVIAVLAGYVASRTRGTGAPFLEVFRVSGAVAFCCYVVALWQDWIWWGKGTRLTILYSIDGIICALVTGATFGWLWPR